MTGASTTGGVPSLPRQDTVFAVAVALGAVGAAVAGAHVAHGDAPLPAAGAITADLDLVAHPVAAPQVSPVAGAVRDVHAPGGSVPDLVRAHRVAAHDTVVEAAVARFESTIGTTRYEHYCERAVENAFGTQGHYASAIADWRARDQHPDWRHAPRGALVFYDTSANGHVALSLGDGRVVSSSAHHRVGVVPVDHFQHPLGWAPAPF